MILWLRSEIRRASACFQKGMYHLRQSFSSEQGETTLTSKRFNALNHIKPLAESHQAPRSHSLVRSWSFGRKGVRVSGIWVSVRVCLFLEAKRANEAAQHWLLPTSLVMRSGLSQLPVVFIHLGQDPERPGTSIRALACSAPCVMVVKHFHKM